MWAGMLMLFRHGASLSDLNVLVLYLQERFGWRAGQIKMVLGAVVLNQTLATNHWAGRYIAL